MNPEDEPSSVRVWHKFLNDSGLDENGEITIQVPHKVIPDKTLTVTFKRLSIEDFNND